LEELSFEDNFLQSLDGLCNLENLRKLNVSNNELHYSDHDDAAIADTLLQNKKPTPKIEWKLSLNKLIHLSISKNKLKSLKFITQFPFLIELYASFNHLDNLRDLFHLKGMQALTIVDFGANQMCLAGRYRQFVIYHLKSVKSLDGDTIEPFEINESRDMFGGKLTCDLVAEKLNCRNDFSEIKTLEFPQYGIRFVDLTSASQLSAGQNLGFKCLRTVNLENNSLTTLSGLIHLRTIKVLCLNNNKIESILPKLKGGGYQKIDENDVLLPNLEVLHLGFNGISDLVNLQIGRLKSLKALFLQGNEITKIDGLENLIELRELVLDKNKIKMINEASFVGQANRLHELHIEENRLKDLQNIPTLRVLQKLYVANNKISEFADIERLFNMTYLQEISLINNPVFC
jgi:Leucine-rich repeat (LRR) protein